MGFIGPRKSRITIGVLKMGDNASEKIVARTPVRSPSRRKVLLAAGAVAAASVVGWNKPVRGAELPAPAVRPARKKIIFSWNQGALCTSAVPVALERGYFAKRGLDVDLINFAGSTDQLLESIGTGKADAAMGMILRWLKPLEQGFDVKLVAGIHGGCLYLVASRAAGITDLTSLRGKAIGVADFAGPDKNFFEVVLQKQGLDPEKDVAWRQYPADLFAVAVEKGEIQAYIGADPLVYLQVQSSKGNLFRLASNATGEYASRTCCVLGIRGSLLRQDRDAAVAVTEAVIEGAEAVNGDPDHAVTVFSQYTPQHATDTKSLSDMLQSYPYGHQLVGDEFRAQVVQYAAELKQIGVFRPGTDVDRYAKKITYDLLS